MMILFIMGKKTLPNLLGPMWKKIKLLSFMIQQLIINHFSI